MSETFHERALKIASKRSAEAAILKSRARKKNALSWAPLILIAGVIVYGAYKTWRSGHQTTVPVDHTPYELQWRAWPSNRDKLQSLPIREWSTHTAEREFKRLFFLLRPGSDETVAA